MLFVILVIWKYRKIPKISPGANIFQRPFLRGLFLEGLIFGGAYLHRRTGNFLPGGGGKLFAQKNLAVYPHTYERVEKKGGPYYNNVGRTGISRWLDRVSFQGQYQV